MTDLGELELDKSTVDPDEGRGRRIVQRAAIVAGVLVVAAESAAT